MVLDKENDSKAALTAHEKGGLIELLMIGSAIRPINNSIS